MGAPSTMHSTVLADAVFRLSDNAASDEVLVINDPNFVQSTFITKANNGTATKSPPATAGR